MGKYNCQRCASCIHYTIFQLMYSGSSVKKLGISRLTKLCIAVPKLDKLLADDNVRMYKNLIRYETTPVLLLQETCKYDSTALFVQVILDFPRVAMYIHEAIVICWKNNYFNVFNMLWNMYSDKSDRVAEKHNKYCIKAVISGDTTKLPYIEQHFTHPGLGDVHVRNLMNELSDKVLEKAENFIQLVQIGCIHSGIESVILKMCYKHNNAEEIEKLYNATSHLLNHNLIKRKLYRSDIASLETWYLLLSLDMFPEGVRLKRFIDSGYNLTNAKKFIERYNITDKEVITNILVAALKIENIGNIQYLLTLNWNAVRDIPILVDGYIRCEKLELVNVILPYIDKILSVSTVDCTYHIITYLYCKGYTWNSCLPHVVKKINMLEAANKTILEIIKTRANL